MALVPGNKKKLKDLKIKSGAIDDMNVNTNYGTIDEVAIGGTSLNNPTITYTPRYIDRKINFGSTSFNMKVGRLSTPPVGSTSMYSYNGIAGTVYGYSESFNEAVMGAGLHSTGVTSSIGFLGYGNTLTSYGFINPYSYTSSNLYNVLTRPSGYQYNIFTVGTSVTASSIGSITSNSPTQDNDFHSYTDEYGTNTISDRDNALFFATNGTAKSYTIAQLVFFKNTGTGGTFPPAQPWNSSDLADSDSTNHCILVLKTNNAYSGSTTFPHLENHGPVKLSIYPNSTATGTPMTLYLNQTAGQGTPMKSYKYTASLGHLYSYSWNNITDATINSIDFTGDHHVRLEGDSTNITPNNGLVEEFGPTGANYTGYDMSDYYAGGDNVVAETSAGDNSNVPTSGEIALSNFHGAAAQSQLAHSVTHMEAFQLNNSTYTYSKGYRKSGYLNVYDTTNGFGTGAAEGAMTGTNITINSKTFEIVGTYYTRDTSTSAASFTIVLDPNGSNTSNPVASDFGSNSYFKVQQDESQTNGSSQWDLRVTSSSTSADPSMSIFTESYNFGGGAGYPLTYISWGYDSSNHSNYSNFVTFWEDNNAYYWYSLSSDGRDYSFQYYVS